MSLAADPPGAQAPGAGTYAGLFLVAAATLTFEILLTRIFSVTLWYHFAFVAVSVAMFGMTAGALLVYLRPAWFPAARTRAAMGACAAAFGVSLVGATLAHLALPTASAFRLSATYVLASVPFVFSGIYVCLALTRFPQAVSRLYAVDLAGAALGCVGLLLMLAVLDGISAVFATAVLALAAAVASAPAEARALRAASAALLALMCAATALNNVASHRQQPLVAIQWVKTGREAPPLYERWNAFSRVTVHAYAPTEPVGWGMSPKFRPERQVPLAWLRMDALAGTLLTEFRGDLAQVDYLRMDIVNLAHHLRPGARTAVIGAGGGRDVLSALVFGSREVVALELNDVILDTVNARYGDFTGHLDRIPGVRFVHDEARSWLARSGERFDVIQASWIDTFAATAAGAFVLTENSLYTREAWRTFLGRLAPSGILTFTRYYLAANPSEAARLTALAREALADYGVARPEQHILLVLTQREGAAPVGGNATILVSPSPFSPQDVARLRAVCDELGFRVALPEHPRGAEPLFHAAASGEGLAALAPRLPFRLDAPTDDRPFFFNMLSLGKLLDPQVRESRDPGLGVAWMLLWLLATVLGLLALSLGVPLAAAGRSLRPSLADADLVLYFLAIGLGFMFAEIALLQRLSLFLGHPTYGLGVVLFGLLLSTGAGSYLAGAAPRLQAPRGAAALLALLALALGASALGLPAFAGALQGAPTPARIGAALVLLAPLGLLMGTAFPAGMRSAASRGPRLLPWLWGINGAASVLASVLAMLVALEVGIAANLWIATACYAAAAMLLAWSNSPSRWTP